MSIPLCSRVMKLKTHDWLLLQGTIAVEGSGHEQKYSSSNLSRELEEREGALSTTEH